MPQAVLLAVGSDDLEFGAFLGGGGWGNVFAASLLPTRTPVAVKVPLKQCRPRLARTPAVSALDQERDCITYLHSRAEGKRHSFIINLIGSGLVAVPLKVMLPRDGVCLNLEARCVGWVRECWGP